MLILSACRRLEHYATVRSQIRKLLEESAADKWHRLKTLGGGHSNLTTRIQELKEHLAVRAALSQAGISPLAVTGVTESLQI